MSIDVFVLVKKNSTLAAVEWQKVCDAHQMPLQIDPNADLNSPVVRVDIRGKPSGFQISCRPIAALDGAEWTPLVKDYPFFYTLSFGADKLSGASALYAAASLALMLDGKAFDPQEGHALSIEELLATAAMFEAE